MGYSCSYELVNGLEALRKLLRPIKIGRNWLKNAEIYTQIPNIATCHLRSYLTDCIVIKSKDKLNQVLIRDAD